MTAPAVTKCGMQDCSCRAWANDPHQDPERPRCHEHAQIRDRNLAAVAWGKADPEAVWQLAALYREPLREHLTKILADHRQVVASRNPRNRPNAAAAPGRRPSRLDVATATF